MKHNPQSLTSWRITAALAVSAVVCALGPISPVSVLAQQAPAQDPPAAKPTEAPPAAPKLEKSDLSADQVFDQIGQKLDNAETLSCDITQSVMLTGQMFQAVGRYAQASGNRMRLEYRIYPGRAANAKDKALFDVDHTPEDLSKQKPTGLLERVSDGSVLWTKWKNGPQQQVTRRNISEIVEALSDVPNETSVKSLQNLGVGGLQTLMSQLQVGMDFGEVREMKSDSAARLVLVGRWNKKTRADVFKLPDDPKAVLPEYVPDFVRLYVDADKLLPLRIQYLKKHPEQDRVRPVVTLDFRNFALNFKLDDDVAAHMFEYVREKDDEVKEVDLTSSVIESIKKLATDTMPEETTEEVPEKAAP